MKKIYLFSLVLIALIVSACATPPAVPQNQPVQSLQQQPTAAPVQQVIQSQPLRTIGVTGTGQVTLAPDVAYVYIGVQSQSENVAEALSQNNEKAQTVSTTLQDLGIDPKDIQTSGFNIYPFQQYSPTGEMTGTVYNVDNTVYVTVRDLQILGNLLDVTVRAGANSINGITFDVLDKSQALSEARALAIASAQSQAEEMAQAAGVSLGSLQNLNVFTANPSLPMYEGRGGAAMDAAAQVPVSAGQMIIKVDVNATYEIH
jgi:hypothetical protein